MRCRGTGRWGPDLGELSWQTITPATTRWGKMPCSPRPPRSCSMLASRRWSATAGRFCACCALRKASARWQISGSCAAISPHPLGQGPGTTARRVLVVLRLTGWISLVGQHRDPLTGHVLSELYQVQESALHFQQACALDASLPALLQASIGHENNQVDRVAVHIQATLAQAPEAASMVAHDQRHDDDDLPLRRRRRRTRQPTHCHCLVIPLAARLFRNRPDTLAAWRLSRAVRIRRICIKRTYVPRARRQRRFGIAVGELAALPEQCPGRPAKGRAGRLAAAAAASPGSTRRVAGTQPKRHRAQCRGLLLRLGEARFAGEFRLWAGRKETSAAPRPAENRPAGVPHTEHRPEPTAPPASRETALAHIANIRKMLNASTNAGDIAAQAMQARGWQPHPV